MLKWYSSKDYLTSRASLSAEHVLGSWEKHLLVDVVVELVLLVIPVIHL